MQHRSNNRFTFSDWTHDGCACMVGWRLTPQGLLDSLETREALTMWLICMYIYTYMHVGVYMDMGVNTYMPVIKGARTHI